MPPRTKATTTRAGILRPDDFARHVDLQRTEASGDLAPWVEYHWTLRWQLPDGVAFASQVVPHPSCNVTVERGDARRPEADGEAVLVTGVTTRRFDVDVTGRGWVHGIKLRPGALTALTGADARTVAREAGVSATQASRGFAQLPVPLGVSGVSERRLAQIQARGPKFLAKDVVAAGKASAAAADADRLTDPEVVLQRTPLELDEKAFKKLNKLLAKTHEQALAIAAESAGRGTDGVFQTELALLHFRRA